MKATILYLDDDNQNLDSFKANLRDTYVVLTANNPVEAYNLVHENDIQMVITDQRMPSMSGSEFLETMAKEFPNIQRVLLTGVADWKSVVEAVNKGKVSKIVTKPFNFSELKKMISEGLDQFAQSLENEQLIAALKKQNQQFEFILRQRLLS
ncbi:MAG: response regulator [Flavobacteriales bacterium]